VANASSPLNTPRYPVFLIVLLSLAYLSQTGGESELFRFTDVLIMQISGNITFHDGLGCFYMCMLVGQIVFHL